MEPGVRIQLFMLRIFNTTDGTAIQLLEEKVLNGSSKIFEFLQNSITHNYASF